MVQSPPRGWECADWSTTQDIGGALMATERSALETYNQTSVGPLSLGGGGSLYYMTNSCLHRYQMATSTFFSNWF